MQTRAKWQYTVGALALVWGLGVGARPAQAGPIVCGSTLGPGGSFALSADLGPCAGPGPALTVISATLDLKGHTVTCTDTGGGLGDGIVLQGTKATLLNGTVTGCFDGVELQGTGSHQVTNVTSTGNTNEGFDEVSGSNANKLSSNTASNNGSVVSNHACGVDFCCDFVTGGFGFDLNGNGNILRSNSATGNFDDGVHLDGSSNNLAGDKSNDNDRDDLVLQCNDNLTVFDDGHPGGDGFDVNGDSNLLSGVTATGNDDDGVDIDGNKNRVTGSTANNNEDTGMVVNGGGHNTFSSNTANGNEEAGFDLNSGSGVNIVTGNKADGNEEGFEMSTDGNVVTSNTATNNDEEGFEIEDGGSNNLIKANVALNNGEPGITIESGGLNNIVSSNKAFGNGSFDLEDDNGGCDSNAWVADAFGSANQSCIH